VSLFETPRQVLGQQHQPQAAATLPALPAAQQH
jgi:hypothetical protein